MLPKHLRGLSQWRAENIKHSNSLTRIPACLSMPRRSCQHLIPMVLKRSNKAEEQKYRYIQYVPQLGIDEEIERWKLVRIFKRGGGDMKVETTKDEREE